MTKKPASARLTVSRSRASAHVVARAALELTSSCYVWLEREGDDTAVTLTEMAALGDDLEGRFAAELERVIAHDRLSRQTRLHRSAIIGRALGPAPVGGATTPQAPVLDPETEAEIEKLLAEIESDDWLDEASEIAKTWEERFGVDPNPECKEDES